jgi:hypothetical protein
MDRGRVGEDRGSKETDGCPLTEGRRLSVSRHPESCWTLNTKVVGFGCGPWRWYKGVGEIHINKGRVGEERKGKKIDGCPLTTAVSITSISTSMLRDINPGLEATTLFAR